MSGIREVIGFANQHGGFSMVEQVSVDEPTTELVGGVAPVVSVTERGVTIASASYSRNIGFDQICRYEVDSRGMLGIVVDDFRTKIILYTDDPGRDMLKRIADRIRSLSEMGDNNVR